MLKKSRKPFILTLTRAAVAACSKAGGPHYTHNFLSGKIVVDLTTIATFDNMPAAHIAKGRLEAEGIPCWLKDENLGQTDWLYNIALGWIKLQVEPRHIQRARTILDTDYSDDLDPQHG